MLMLGLFILMIPFALSAQISVSGTVLDSNNEPLPGVNVVQTGTTNGTITDLDGKYTISVPSDATLTFSYIGFTNHVENVNGRSTIPAIVLESDDAEIEQVVVVGYGTQRKSDLTGSVASVGGDEMKNRATSDAAAALQGKAAGVQVLTNSGAPGTGAEIRVRGMSSNTGNLGPLLIVDGLKVDNIQYLDPEMIESMEILKDAASAAIYGAQAGNGVVLITTKNGKKSKDGQIFYNAQFSLSSLSRDLDVMNATQYLDYGTRAGVSKITEGYKNWDGGKTVNWQDEVFEPTWNSRHTVGFQGGNDRGTYYLALNHVKTNGIFVGNKDTYRRLSAQINGDYKIKQWLTVGSNNSIEKWETKSISQQSDNGSALLAAITSDPFYGPLCQDDSQLTAEQKDAIAKGITVLGDGTHYYRISPISGESQSGNPLMMRDRTDGSSNGINIRGTSFLNFNPIEGLVFTSRLGYRIGQSNRHNYAFPYWGNSFNKSETYQLDAAANTNYYYQWENFINYNKTFAEKHAVGAMAGMSWEENHSDNVSVTLKGPDILARGYAKNNRYAEYAASGDDCTKEVHNLPGESKNMSYFGRLTYAYDNTYSIQFNLRADAFDSSKLPSDQRWGVFPSFSAGWTLSNESFISDNISTDILSFLKLRGSWGRNGNINVLSGYPYAVVMNVNEDKYQYTDEPGEYAFSSVPNGMPNPDLKWETSEQLDLGFDARFLNSRLTIGFDWFKKTTKDLIVNVKPVIESGIGTTSINAGEVENTGIEVELGWKDKIGKDINYSISSNFATLKNELTYLDPKVAGGALDGVGLQGSKISTRCTVGEPLWYFWGYESDGLDENGHAKFKDQNGDGKTDKNDYVNIGNGLPKFTYGITINVDYKGFDLLVFGSGVAGNKILPQGFRTDRPYCNTYAWYYENAGSKFPVPEEAGWSKDVFSSDFTIFDGSYFKIKTIQLGYTLPANISKKAFISNMRVFASLENFFTFTKYIGLDPEAASANSSNQLGIDFGTYPTAKQVVLGFNITF